MLLFMIGILVLALCIKTHYLFIFHWLIYFPGLLITGLLLFILCFLLTIRYSPILCAPLCLYLLFIWCTDPSPFEISSWQWLSQQITPYIWPHSDYSKQFPVAGTPFPSQCIYVIHPHGLVLSTLFAHVCSTSSPLFYTITHTSIGAHSLLLKVPIAREILLYRGAVPIAKESLTYELQKGRSIAIIPGGLKEIQANQHDRKGETWYLRERKGFLKLAATHSLPIVPIYIEREQTFLSNIVDLSGIDSFYNPHHILTGALGVLSGFSFSNLQKWFHVYSSPAPVSITHIGKPFYVKGDLTIAQTDYIAHIQELFHSVHKGARTLEIL